MKIVIDGMDGSGKSTLAKKIAKNYNMKYVDGLLHSFFKDQNFTIDEIKIIDRAISEFYKIDNAIIRAWFLASGNVFNLLNYSEDVIIDRSVLTTYYWNGTQSSKDIFKYMHTLVEKADLTIILLASPKKRFDRVKKRDLNDKDLLEKEKFDEGYYKYIQGAKFLNLNYVILDTDNKNIEEVYDEAKILIDQLKSED